MGQLFQKQALVVAVPFLIFYCWYGLSAAESLFAISLWFPPGTDKNSLLYDLNLAFLFEAAILR